MGKHRSNQELMIGDHKINKHHRRATMRGIRQAGISPIIR